MKDRSRPYSRSACREAADRRWRRVAGRAISSVPAFGMALVMALGLSACSSDQVPTDALLSITPGTHSTTITERQDELGNCLYHPEHHVDIPLIMQLTTADGSPIGDALLNVYVDFAENTYTGIPVLALYDDRNSNGVVDHDSELVSGIDDDIARVRTEPWSGSRLLLLRINLSCSFRGEVVAFIGGVTARAEIDVVADDIQSPQNETTEKP